MTDLFYTGNGAFVVGIPAADLTIAEQATVAARLNLTPEQLHKQALESGLYVEPKPKPIRKEKSA